MIKKVIKKIEIKRLRDSLSPFSKAILPFCSLLFIFCFFIFPLHAADKGTSGAQFLKIGIGARAVGMGEAYAGMEGDINSIYWNPAGLSNINALQTSFSHTKWFQNINYENLMVGYPFGFGVMALGINYLSTDAIDKYRIKDDSYEKAGSYKASDTELTVAFAKEVKNIPVGANLKFISSSIDDESASAFALDFGGIYRLNRLNLGLAIQNLGMGMKFRNESDPLPLNIKFGGVYKLSRRFITALDFNFPNDSDFRINAGVEYGRKYGKAMDIMARLGYKTNSDFNAIDGLSIGFGMKYRTFELNYVWAPYGDLGATHRISFTYKPEGKLAVRKVKPAKKKKKIKSEKKKKKVKPPATLPLPEKEKPAEEVEDLDEEIRRLEQELFKKEEVPPLEKKKSLSPEEIKKLKSEHFNKATQLYKQKKYKEAITEWEKVLELDPGHKLSKQKIEKTKEKLKK